MPRKKKKKPLIGKAFAQRRHAERRFLQRTGVILTDQLHDQLIAKIRRGGPGITLVEKQSNRVSIWDVIHEIKNEEVTLRIVYDRMRRNIATILNNTNRTELFLFDPERKEDV